MRIKIVKPNSQIISIWAVVFLFADLQIHYFFNTLSSAFGLGLINTVYYGIKYGTMLLFLCSIHMRIKKGFVASVFLIFVVIGLTAVLFPQNKEYMFKDRERLIDIVWTLFVCFHFSAWEKLDDVVETSTKIAGITAGVCYPINELLLGNHVPSSGYMSMTYMILTGTIGFLYFGIKRHSIRDLAIAVVLLVEVFVAGARGPLLCVAVIMMIAVIRLYQRNSYKAVGIFTATLTLGVVVVVNLEWILNMLENVAGRFGMNLRLVRLLENSEFASSTSTVIRSRFREVMGEAILKNPLGLGVYGDRVLGIESNLGTGYAHNLFYEILIDYGILVGGAFVLWLAYRLVCHLKAKKSTFESTIDIIAGMTVTKLMVSSSYWYEPLFFMLIFLLLRGKRTRKDVRE